MIGDHDWLAGPRLWGIRAGKDVEVFADPLGIGQESPHVDAVAMLGLEVLDCAN